MIKFLYRISLFISILAYFLPFNILASGCNSSDCEVILNSEEMELQTSSIYGHFLNRIVLTNCCARPLQSNGQEDPKLQIGALGPAHSGPSPAGGTTPMDLFPGQTVALRDVPGDPIFTQDPSLSSVILKAEWRDAVCSGSTCSIKLCLTMPTSLGYSPLKCKLFDNVMAPGSNTGGMASFSAGSGASGTQNTFLAGTAAINQLTTGPEVCNRVADSCDDTKVSQSMFSFSGPAVQCLADTLREQFFDPQPGCIVRNNAETNVNMSYLANFGIFQEAMKMTVRALLILYVMGFGIKMLLNQSEFSVEAVVMFVMKMFLVGYFAVGWGPAYFADGVKKTENGAMKWALPILTQLTSDMASITFSAATGHRGLCEFDNNHYPPGYGYYGLWDRIDCKLGAYLLMPKTYGLGFLQKQAFLKNWVEIPVTNQLNDISQNNPDGLLNTMSRAGISTAGTAVGLGTGVAGVASSTSVGGSLTSGPNVSSNIDSMSDPRPEGDADAMNVAKAAEQIGIFVIIFKLFLGGQFLVFVALIYFMVIVLSVSLGFISLYTVCLVTMHILVYLSPIFVPLVLFERTKSYFDSWVKVTLSCALQPLVIGCFMGMVFALYDGVFYGSCLFKRHDYTNGERYKSTFEIRIPHDNPGECIISTGYVLISYLLGLGGDSYGAVIFTVEIIRDVANLWLNCIMLLVFSYIMRFFLDSLYTFAADITGGMNVSAVAINMSKVAENLNKVANAAVDKMTKKGGDKGKGEGRRGGSGAGSGEKEEKDDGPSMDDKDDKDDGPSMDDKGGDDGASMDAVREEEQKK